MALALILTVYLVLFSILPRVDASLQATAKKEKVLTQAPLRSGGQTWQVDLATPVLPPLVVNGTLLQGQKTSTPAVRPLAPAPAPALRVAPMPAVVSLPQVAAIPPVVRSRGS